ncbi:MAG: SDR family oxidoreductase [Treponemataceae bacterium]|nr:SDR family oxidoreductase [Treponemataceae bacterium]
MRHKNCPQRREHFIVFWRKTAVSNFTEWLAVHFAPSGIRVNAIAPGFFVTDQNRSLLFNSDGTPTARTEKILLPIDGGFNAYNRRIKRVKF